MVMGSGFPSLMLAAIVVVALLVFIAYKVFKK